MLPGGEVLFVAGCGRGTAPTAKAREEFCDRLAAPLAQVLAGVERDYVLYSHKNPKKTRRQQKLGVPQPWRPLFEDFSFLFEAQILNASSVQTTNS